MISYNMTAGEDNQVIWFVKITLDNIVLRACDYGNSDLSLTNTWSSNIIKYNSMDSINESIDLEYGGSTGLLTNVQFEIIRRSDVSGIEDFFNSFAPATSKPFLTSRRVEIGIGWDGITSDSQITWVYDFYIEDYSYDYSSIKLFCIEFAELESKELPPYEVQKDFANGISYFPDAPDGSIGKEIPIIYGDFSQLDLNYTIYNLTPAILINKREHEYLISSHKCKEVSAGPYVYEDINNGDSVMLMRGKAGKTTVTNELSGHKIKLNTDGSEVRGDLILQPQSYLKGNFVFDGSVPSVDFNGTNLENATDKDNLSFATLGINETAAFQLNTDISDIDLGSLTYSGDSSVTFNVLWSSSDSNTQNIQVSCYHPVMGVNSGFFPDPLNDSTNGTIKLSTFNFGDGTHGGSWGSNPKKWQDWPIWSIEELQRILFIAYNKNTSTASIKIFNAYLKITDIMVYFRLKGRAKIDR